MKRLYLRLISYLLPKGYSIIEDVKDWDELSCSEQLPYFEHAENILQDLNYCTRVWSAWGIGTMTENDFTEAVENPDILEEVAKEVYLSCQSHIDQSYLKIKHGMKE